MQLLSSKDVIPVLTQHEENKYNDRAMHTYAHKHMHTSLPSVQPILLHCFVYVIKRISKHRECCFNYNLRETVKAVDSRGTVLTVLASTIGIWTNSTNFFCTCILSPETGKEGRICSG